MVVLHCPCAIILLYSWDGSQEKVRDYKEPNPKVGKNENAAVHVTHGDVRRHSARVDYGEASAQSMIPSFKSL